MFFFFDAGDMPWVALGTPCNSALDHCRKQSEHCSHLSRQIPRFSKCSTQLFQRCSCRTSRQRLECMFGHTRANQGAIHFCNRGLLSDSLLTILIFPLTSLVHVRTWRLKSKLYLDHLFKEAFKKFQYRYILVSNKTNPSHLGCYSLPLIRNI